MNPDVNLCERIARDHHGDDLYMYGGRIIDHVERVAHAVRQTAVSDTDHSVCLAWLHEFSLGAGALLQHAVPFRVIGRLVIFHKIRENPSLTLPPTVDMYGVDILLKCDLWDEIESMSRSHVKVKA